MCDLFHNEINVMPALYPALSHNDSVEVAEYYPCITQ
jgi:hypothetical protein